MRGGLGRLPEKSGFAQSVEKGVGANTEVRRTSGQSRDGPSGHLLLSSPR